MDCSRLQRLNAYYDGQLSPQDARAMAAHVEACPDCSAALREMEELSRAFAGLAGGRMSAIGAARALEAADAAANSASRSLAGAAGLLAGLAASILTVASAWLLESSGTAPVQRPAVVRAPAPAPEWERLAMTLDVWPLEPDDQPMLAEADLADWMLRNLNR
jgi:anti-sigma factor RsiW